MERESESLSQRNSRAESQLGRTQITHTQLITHLISRFARLRPAGANKSLLLTTTLYCRCSYLTRVRSALAAMRRASSSLKSRLLSKSLKKGLNQQRQSSIQLHSKLREPRTKLLRASQSLSTQLKRNRSSRWLPNRSLLKRASKFSAIRGYTHAVSATESSTRRPSKSTRRYARQSLERSDRNLTASIKGWVAKCLSRCFRTEHSQQTKSELEEAPSPSSNRETSILTHRVSSKLKELTDQLNLTRMACIL